MPAISGDFRILVADDDPDFVVVLKRFLEREGFTCEAVSDGPQTLAALRIARYDLLIADIDMPGNRALELVQAIEADKDRPLVLLLTGSPSIETAKKSVGLSVFAYITKPFDPMELRQLIGEAAASGRIRRAVAESEERIRAWSTDMARIRELLQQSPGASTGVQSYVTVTLGNLVAAVSDFAEVIEVMSRSGAQHQKIESAALLNAVRETITVLESTRTVFKSKELGALRKKLEVLLQ